MTHTHPPQRPATLSVAVTVISVASATNYVARLKRVPARVYLVTVLHKRMNRS